MNAKLDGGTAGDLITCRPFDASLQLFNRGHLVDLSGMAELADFPETATAAWSTDDGSATFCMPMASVIHGFMYNKEAFAELGLEVPTTEEEFFAVLDAIKADGSYEPMAMGTADQWEAATMGYTNIGPNYWQGEAGRLALIDGEARLTDEAYVAPYRTLARWADYLPSGFEAQSYPDSQNLFTLGRAAIYPDRLLGDLALPARRLLRDGRLQAAGRERGRRLLHQRPRRYRHRHQRREPEPGSGDDLHRVGGLGRVRRALLERAARLLLALQPPDHARGSDRPGVHRLARGMRLVDPPGAPDPQPRHAEPVERHVGDLGQRHQRHDDARGGGRAAADGLASWYEPQQ